RSVSTVSKSGSLSSWLSLLYASGCPLMSVSRATSAPYTRPVLPRISSGTSGFFFCGMIEEPVQNRSASWTKAKRGFDQITSVAREHLVVGHQVMSERDRLRHLQVREARHQGVHVRLGQVQQPLAERAQDRPQRVDLAAQPQADVGGDLVVARAGDVEALAGV